MESASSDGDGNNSSAGFNEVGWYIIGENQEHVGSYAFSELQEHFSNGYIAGSTLLWADRRNEWLPLSLIPELYSGMSIQRTDNFTADLSGNTDDDFAKWEKEVREADAAVEALKHGNNDQLGGGVHERTKEDPDERPSTPPDGEEEFTDDDGTTYKWDRGLRAWLPQEMHWSLGQILDPYSQARLAQLACIHGCICKHYREIVGSAYYVAPEVLRRNYGKEIDVWSAGVILYILLCGVPSFWAETEKVIFDAISQGDLDFSTEPWPSISHGAKDLIRKMLTQDSKKRITAAKALEHAWLRENGEASDKPIDNAVLNRMKQFRAMNKLKKLALKAIAESFSEEDIKGLKQMFKNMDTDGHGTITYEELRMDYLGLDQNLLRLKSSSLWMQPMLTRSARLIILSSSRLSCTVID